MCSSIVPAMVRTDPEPTPNRRVASSAASRSRWRRQPEVVVRRKVDDRTVVDGGVGALVALEHAQTPEQSLRLERVELQTEVGERIVQTGPSVVSRRESLSRRSSVYD